MVYGSLTSAGMRLLIIVVVSLYRVIVASDITLFVIGYYSPVLS